MPDKWTGIAEAFPPGEFIREELEFRGWTQQQLADRMERPVQVVNMIVNGRKAITAETALQLQKAFGPSAAYWMGLEADYQIYKLNKEKKAAKRRTREKVAGTE
jgi:HTH-type transcriptional regulator/antitoxin HigA